MTNLNYLEVFSATLERTMRQYAGRETTPAQVGLIEEAKRKFQFGEIIPAGDSIILLPQETEFDPSEISAINQMLGKAPQTFEKFFQHRENPKPKVVGIIPGSWGKPIDGQGLVSLGVFFSETSKTLTHDLIYVLANGEQSGGNYWSAAYLFHEMYHPEINALIETPMLPFFNEGLGEFLVMMYMNEGSKFLNDPISSASAIVNSSSEFLLRKKGSLGFPLVLPTLFASMPPGSYISWLETYFSSRQSISQETAREWLEYPVRDRVSNALQAILQYKFNLASIVTILGRGISLDDFCQKLIQAHQNDSEIGQTERSILMLKDFGISTTRMMDETRELGIKNLNVNYQFANNDIIQHYIKSVAPLLNGCSWEDAERVMQESQISWK